MNVKDVFLFKDLNKEDIKKIESFSIIKKLSKNEIVFFEKEKSTYLHILLKGKARVYKVDSKGNELVIHRFSAVTLIAERANLENIPYPANCAMDSDGVILKIEWDKFKDFITKSNICFHIMNSLLKKMNYLDNLIHTKLILNTKTKIAKFIYEYPDLFESLKQHNIADLLNIKPETLSRKLKKFKELGIIENVNNKLIVKDREKLKELYDF